MLIFLYKVPILSGTYLYTPSNSLTSKLYTFTNNGKTCTEGLYDNSGKSVDGVMAFNRDTFDDDPNALKRLTEVYDFTAITDVTNIVLKICKSGVCEDADGFVKYGPNSKSVGRCSQGSCSDDLGDDIVCSENNGELKYRIEDNESLTIGVCIGEEYENINKEDSAFNDNILYYEDEDNKNAIKISLQDTVFLKDNDRFHGWKFISDKDVNPNAYAFTTIDLFVGYYAMDDYYRMITKDTTEGLLLSCSKNGEANEISCTFDSNIGYYKNYGDNKTTYPFIECFKYSSDDNGDTSLKTSSNRCKIIAKPTGITCSKENIGLLDNDGKLCLGIENGPSGNIQSYDFTTVDGNELQYLTEIYNENSAFKNIIESGKLLLIKITSNAMINTGSRPVCLSYQTDTTLISEDGCDTISYCEDNVEENKCYDYSCENGLCVTGGKESLQCKLQDSSGTDCENGGYIFIRDNVMDRTEHRIPVYGHQGYLFYCPGSNVPDDNDHACKQITEKGYFVKDGRQQYYFCNGTKCKSYKDTDIETNCDISNIGKLFRGSNDALSICLGVEENEGNEGGVAVSAVLKDYSKEVSVDDKPIFNPGKFALANSVTTSYVVGIPKINDGNNNEVIDETKYAMVDIYEDKAIIKTNCK